MALFSTGIALASGLLAAKLMNKKKDQQSAMPTATTPPVVGSPLSTPTPPIVNPAANQAAANQAGEKAKKKARAGSLLGDKPVSDKMPVSPSLRPKTLIGY